MLQIEPDSTRLAAAAAETIARLIEAAVQDRGRACIALAGGSTPRAAYQLLAAEPYRSRLPWAALHIFWGDERWVPQTHPDSNAGMARDALLEHVPIPPDQIYPAPTELGDAHAAAAAYARRLAEVAGAAPGHLPRLDLVLLGLGDDAHTASLFPGSSALGERAAPIVASYVEKLSSWRLTLSAPAICAARSVLFLVSGQTKAPALRSVLRGPADPARYPAHLIHPAEEPLWLVDQAAASLLET